MRALFVLGMTMGVIVGCLTENDTNKMGPDMPDMIVPTNITIDITSFTITNGIDAPSGTLTATVLPTNYTEGEIIWSSENTNVITINASNGDYQVIAAGEAVITVSIGVFSATITITFSIPAINISIDRTSFTATNGEVGVLTAAVSPVGHTDGAVHWSSADTNVVTIDNNGNYEAVGAGASAITATVGSVSNSITITVGIPATGIVIEQTNFTATKGDMGTLTAVVSPVGHTEGAVSWSSADTNVVTIDSNGNYEAVGAGASAITATVGSVSNSITITVGIPATGIVIEQTNFTATQGDMGTLTAVVSPVGHTEGAVSWSSADTNVVTIDSSGNYEAVGAGASAITAMVGSVSNSIIITVSIPATNIAIDRTNFTAAKGEVGVLMAVVSPNNHTDGEVDWSSADTNVVTIDNNGNYEAVEVGASVITATVGSVSNSITITVSIPATNIAIDRTNFIATNGERGLLNAAVLPVDHTEGAVHWSSADTSVVTIDSSGNYEAVGAGASAITAMVGSVSNSITITVGIPDLIVANVDVSDSDLTQGQSFTLSGTVRNAGLAMAETSILSFYFSTDSTIDASDTLVGMNAIPSLNAGGSNFQSIQVTAPTGGTYYYGACVSLVASEEDTNNCSMGIKVVVNNDFNTLSAAGNNNPQGLWSDGTTMWVTDGDNDKLYAYNLSTKARDSSKDFNTLSAAGNNSPQGLWSDGTTMWVTDSSDDKLYAYNLSTKARDSSKDFNTLSAAENNSPQGLWSDGATLWVADSSDDKLYAYNLSTKTRDSSKDFNTLSAAGNNSPIAMWSDGTTLWVADITDAKIYAYNLLTKARNSSKDFNTLSVAQNDSPRGIWSDGTTMWVVDNFDDKIYSYDASGVVTTTLDLGISVHVSNNRAEPGQDITLSVLVLNSGLDVASSTTVRWYRSTDQTISSSDTLESTASVDSLTAGSSSSESITLPLSIAGTYYYGACVDEVSGEVSSDNNCSGGIMIVVTTNDFNTLINAGNTNPQGLWSDGTTMWVADEDNDKLYAYNLSTKARDSSEDFNTLSAAGNTDPRGLWSDGITMWVTDGDNDKLYAYNLSTKARDSDKDFDSLSSAGNQDPTGLWSDGTSMWVADSSDDKLYAYNLSTKARDSGKDFDSLSSAGNQDPTGLWSDGTSMWVADSANVNLYAYNLSTKARNSSKDFDSLSSARNDSPQGLWSDGTTMWVADSYDGRIYSYGASGVVTTAPDLGISVVLSTNSSSNITLSAVVLNSGLATADPTTLRWYRSIDQIISSSDTLEGTASVGSLAAGRNSSEDITLSLPGIGIYYYGACVDGVGVEVSTDNNCSGGIVASVSNDFDTLSAAGNTDPQGIWSDGTNMWVANDGFGSENKIYAYNLLTKARDSSKDFDTLNAAGNTDARGLWSDGTTMWVANDGFGSKNKIYAYNLSTKARDSSKDFDTLNAAGNTDARGLWSDGTNMWVANDGGGSENKIYAYNLSTKARDSSKDFDTLNAAGNTDPQGLWSDGTTMWVANDGVGSGNKIYAYNLLTKARDSSKDFDSLSAAENTDPKGIWSEGTIMWVVDSGDDKIYSYPLH